MLFGIIFFSIFSDPQGAINAMLTGAKESLTLSVQLCAIYALWLSVLELVKACHIDTLIGRFFAPVCGKLFPNEDKTTLDLIAMNFSANLLGMGGAATPLGIQAINRMSKGDVATDNTILFTIINTTSIQLIPATVIALRASHGSVTPSDILLPSLITTTVTTLVGILCCLVLRIARKPSTSTRRGIPPLSTMFCPKRRTTR